MIVNSIIAIVLEAYFSLKLKIHQNIKKGFEIKKPSNSVI